VFLHQAHNDNSSPLPAAGALLYPLIPISPPAGDLPLVIPTIDGDTKHTAERMVIRPRAERGIPSGGFGADHRVWNI
jgi:hypothetical protein